MAESAKWYVAHTYSGYENAVKTAIEKFVANRHLEDMIIDIQIPMETVTEVTDSGEVKEVERKVFPGYVLVKMVMTDDTWHLIRNIRGVTGFVGSPIWKYMYSFPQTTEQMIEKGFQEVFDLWCPILEVFRQNGIKYCLEVHPAEIAFDYYTTKRLLEKFREWPEFGLNFDPSHLQWQGISPHLFLEDFIDRVYHVHMKDCAVTLNGRNGLLCSHLDFGDLRRGWNFRSLGHGDVNFEEIIRVLNAYGYDGPLSVEWEDSGMDREYGAREALEFVRKIDFKPSDIKFDAAIKS
jgi:transcription antitermination factor NusG